MKKKNILLMLVLFVAVFLPSVVHAGAATGWEIYCGDFNTTVSKEEPVRCYLIAKIENDAGGKGIFGVATGIELNSKLEFVSGTPAGVIDSNYNVSPQYFKGVQSEKFGRNCNELSGCFDFYANTGQTIVDKKGNNPGGDADIIKFNQEHSAYTIVGWYDVKLKDDATASDCGQFCINVDVYAEENNQTSAVGIQGTLDNGGCKQIKPTVVIEEKPKACRTEGSGDSIKYYGKDGTEVTKEQYDKDCGNPGTGGWASYAVLAAGAFIALSAITIAKKHNKFYQV